MSRILILSDSPNTKGLVSKLIEKHPDIEVAQSSLGELEGIERISVQNNSKKLSRQFDLIVSIHCKEIFPEDLVESVRCINVHPGFNPYNRGWFPHVFSLINGEPAGVTIHEMDSKIDNGPIIVQRECEVFTWDTSSTLYNRIIALEEELVLDWFPRIRDNEYTTSSPDVPGSFNNSNDFENLKPLLMDEISTIGEIINRLRALSHGEIRNAFFLDPDGSKIFVRLEMFKE